MRVLARILYVFNSYAIIATHSPLVIREMVNANVQFLRKMDDNSLKLSKVAYNTFGEDITTLYYNIFNYDIKDSFFASVITEFVKKGMTYDQIVAVLSPDMKLGLNAKMTIRDIIDEGVPQDVQFDA